MATAYATSWPSGAKTVDVNDFEPSLLRIFVCNMDQRLVWNPGGGGHANIEVQITFILGVAGRFGELVVGGSVQYSLLLAEDPRGPVPSVS